MTKKNPADAGRRQGSGLVVCFPARDYDRDSLSVPDPQSLATRHLAARFGMLPATAQAVAEANQWGGR